MGYATGGLYGGIGGKILPKNLVFFKFYLEGKLLKANFSKKPAKKSLVYMAEKLNLNFYVTNFKFYFPAM